MTSWSEWGQCTETCGGGERTRNRTVIVKADHGGDECPSQKIETEQCNEHECRKLSFLTANSQKLNRAKYIQLQLGHIISFFFSNSL